MSDVFQCVIIVVMNVINFEVRVVPSSHLIRIEYVHLYIGCCISECNLLVMSSTFLVTILLILYICGMSFLCLTVY